MIATILKIISLLIIFMVSVDAQNMGRIEYHIADSVIKTRLESPIINLMVELKNSTEENFLMYGFNNTHLSAPTIDSLYSISKSFEWGSGNEMFLLNSDGKRSQVWTNSTIRDDFENSDIGKSITKSLAELYLESVEILTRNSKKKTQLTIDLSNTGPLEKGTYLFYLIYTSGQLSRNVIGENKIIEDQSKWQAIIFEGFIISNVVKLIIE